MISAQDEKNRKAYRKTEKYSPFKRKKSKEIVPEKDLMADTRQIFKTNLQRKMWKKSRKQCVSKMEIPIHRKPKMKSKRNSGAEKYND